MSFALVTKSTTLRGLVLTYKKLNLIRTKDAFLVHPFVTFIFSNVLSSFVYGINVKRDKELNEWEKKKENGADNRCYKCVYTNTHARREWGRAKGKNGTKSLCLWLGCVLKWLQYYCAFHIVYTLLTLFFGVAVAKYFDNAIHTLTGAHLVE